jgi:hypothetical protein
MERHETTLIFAARFVHEFGEKDDWELEEVYELLNEYRAALQGGLELVPFGDGNGTDNDNENDWNTDEEEEENNEDEINLEESDGEEDIGEINDEELEIEGEERPRKRRRMDTEDYENIRINLRDWAVTLVMAPTQNGNRVPENFAGPENFFNELENEVTIQAHQR